jgi:hypothetical protein
MPDAWMQLATAACAQISAQISRYEIISRRRARGGVAGNGGRDRAFGGAVDVHGDLAVLLLPSTYLGGASRWPTPPLQTSVALIRAGQLPRPGLRGGQAVLDRGLGWPLRLTQGRSLCILRPLLH